MKAIYKPWFERLAFPGKSCRIKSLTIALLLLFCCTKVAALSYEEYLARLPVYLEQVPETDITQAREHFIYYAPMLIRAYSLFAAENTDPAMIDSTFDQLMFGIASQAQSSLEEIHSFIELQIQPLPLLPETEISSFALFYPENVPPESAKLLQILSAFTLDPEKGRPRMVLHGGMAFKRRLYQLYERSGKYMPFDWDFLLLLEELPSLLRDLRIPEGVAKRLSALLKLPNLRKEHTEVIEISHLSTLSFTIRNTEDGDGSRLLSIKQLKKADDGQKQNKLLLTVDIFFPQELPESSFLLFDAIGWLAVITAPALLASLQRGISHQPWRTFTYAERIQFWQGQEKSTPELEPATHESLMSFNLENEMELPDIEDNPENLFEDEDNTPLPAGFHSIPCFPDQLVELKQSVINTMRLKYSRISPNCLACKFLHDWKDRNNFPDYDPEITTTDSEEKLTEHFRCLNEWTELLGNVYFERQKHPFLINFSRKSCGACHHCNAIKGSFYDWLCLRLKLLINFYEKLSDITHLHPKSLPIMHLAVQTYTMATGLAITMKKHEADAQLIADKQFLSSDMQCDVDYEFPDPFLYMQKLYYLLYDQYISLRQQNPGLFRTYRSLINQWRSHLLHIGKSGAPFVPETGDELFIHTIHELGVFGLLVSDISEVSASLTTHFSNLEFNVSDYHPIDDSLFISQLNVVLYEILFTRIWFQDLSEGSPLSGESIEALLDIICLSPHTYDACRFRIVEIREERAKLHGLLEQQKNDSRKFAEQIMAELAEEEKSLKEARDKLAKSHTHKPIPRNPSHKKQKQRGTEKTPPIVLLQRRQWEIKQDQAHSEIGKSQFRRATRLLNEALEEAPENQKSTILIDLADASLHLTRQQRLEILKLQKEISAMHALFVAKSQAPKSRHLPIPEREALISTSQDFLRLWDDIEKDLNQSLNYHQQALELLQRNKEIDHSDTYQAILISSCKLIRTFFRKTQESRQQLLHTFELRKQWLGTINRPRARPAETVSAKSFSVGELVDGIKKQQQKNEVIHTKSTQLCEKATLLTPQKTTPARVNLNAYQRFSVPGDGDCFFSALAIALNNLGATTEWSAFTVKKAIHEILKKIILHIKKHPKQKGQLTIELAALLGMQYEQLEILVNEEVLLQPPSHEGATACPQASLQQYGEINLLLLLQLTQYIPTGVQLSNHPELQLYNGYLWLDLAPHLLSHLVQHQVFSVEHWSDELQAALVEDHPVTPQMQQQIEHAQVTTILTHSSHGGSALLEHFDVHVLNTESLVQNAAVYLLNIGAIFLWRVALDQVQQTRMKK